MSETRHLTYRIEKHWNCQRRDYWFYGRVLDGGRWTTETEGETRDDAFQTLWQKMIDRHKFEHSGYFIDLETEAEKRKRLRSLSEKMAVSLSR